MISGKLTIETELAHPERSMRIRNNLEVRVTMIGDGKSQTYYALTYNPDEFSGCG